MSSKLEFSSYQNFNLVIFSAKLKQLQSRILGILLISLFSLSLFSQVYVDSSSKENKVNYQYIPSLYLRKNPFSKKSPETHSNSPQITIPQEKIEQTHFLDIEEMKNTQINKVDKNGNRIADSLETKIELQSFDNQTISLIVTTKTNRFEEDVSLFEKMGGIVHHIWDDPDDIVYGFSGDIAASKVKKFSEGTKFSIELIEENLPAIRNSDVATHLAMIRTHVWDNLNYTGDPNMSIAVLDTGIDDSHVAFSPGYEDQNWDKKIVGWYDVTADGSTTPEDYGGHGSHVAGIVAANNYNNSYDAGRIVSTWSYSYDPGGSASGAFVYIIWVNRTGTIDISYVWQGTESAEGTDLELYASNGTLIANDTSGNSNMTVNCTISSQEDFGYWSVALGVNWGASGGMLDVAGVNKYPYPDPIDTHSRFSGVAPDVKLVGVKIFDNTGSGTSSDVIDAFNWVKNNKATYHIAIASGSFSFSGTVVSVDSAAAALVNSGVLVVLSAGNDGQGKNSIFSPGQVDGVITVGASDDYNSITTYSSEGPGETSNTTKPDIVAPGGERTQGAILQVDSNDADSDNITWGDKIANDFTNIQGTSMSCPFVSGSLALLIQAMGGYDYWKDGYGSAINPFKIKQLVLMTANEIYLDDRGGRDHVEGFGRLNIYAAIEAIENTYGIGSIVDGFLSSNLGKRKVWAQSVTLSAEINYTFVLTVPDVADFDLFLYKPDSNQFGEPVLAVKSTNFEAGADEYITYTPTSSGVYFLVVKTSFSNQGSGIFNLASTSGNGYPVVSFVSPSENEELSGQYTVQINAEDSDLKAVYLKVADDTWINTTFTGSYYEYDYNTTALPDCNYSFVAKAVDNQGHITFASINNIYTDNFKQPILLVDDDTGQSYEEYYRRALQRLSLYEGISFDYFSVQTSGNPSSNKLKEYQLVIWHTSTDSTTTLTSTDQSNLQSYLDSGGYLWISGQDIGYDISSSSFYGTYLHAIYQADNVVDKRFVSGVSGELFEGKRYYVGGGAGSGQHGYPSDIDANTGASVILNYYSNPIYGAAIKYSGTHKVMYFAFNWEAMDDEIDRIDSLNKSLNWFNLDKAPISISLTNPVNGTVTNQNPSFSWSGADDYSIEKYAIFRDGIYVTTTTSTSFTLNDQPEGWHSYRIVAFDGKNQSKADMIILFVDTTAPTVQISSPINATYSESFIHIYVTNTTAVDTAWYRYQNGSWSENFSLVYDSIDSRWEKRGLEWNDGSYSVQVFFNDSVGNQAFSQEWFTVDTTAPVVTIVNPSNTTYTISKVTIYATNTSDVDTAWYRYQNGTWSNNYSLMYDPSDSRWEKEGLTWIDGNYLIQVFFNDSAGNEAYDEEWFTVDTTAPLVIIISPTNTTYTTITIEIYATNVTDVHTAWYRYQNGSWSVNYSLIYDSSDSRWEIEGLTWSDGNYLVQVFFNDSLGNEAFSQEWFSVDTTAPIVAIINPGNTTYTITDVVIYAENTTAVDKAWYRYKNGSWSMNYSLIYDSTETRWELEGLVWTDGSYSVQIFFNDSLGNEAFSQEWFTVDTTAPAVTIVSPNNTTYSTTDIAIYAINISDVHTAWYRYQNGSWSVNYPMIYDSIDSRWKMEGLIWNDGIYTLKVFFNDSVGNEAFSEEWFTIDTTAPVVTIISPSNSTYTTIDVAIYATNTTVVDTAWYRYRNGSWSTNYTMSYDSTDNRWEMEGLEWVDGNYLVQVFFNDSVGNEAFRQEWFKMDTTAPIVTITSPSNTTYNQNTVILIYFVSDGTAAIYLDGIANTTYFPSESPISNLSQGSHNITIVAMDLVGNIRITTVIFTVESDTTTTTTTNVTTDPTTTTPLVTTNTTIPLTTNNVPPTTTSTETTKRPSIGISAVEGLIILVLLGIGVRKHKSYKKGS